MRATTRLQRLARTLFINEQAETFEWVLSKPESELRETLLGQLTKIWFEKHADDAAAYVEANLERPAVRSVGHPYLTVHVLRTDVVKAVGLAVQLPERQMIPALKQCLVAWGRRDIEGLKDYVDSNEVPREVMSVVNIEHGGKLKALAARSGQQKEG